MKKICFVCLGNICRSPMAEFVMKSMADPAEVYVESRATSSWEHGNPIHQGTQAILKRYGVPYSRTKTSQQISQEDLENFDVIIGMDQQNVADLRALFPQASTSRIQLFIEGGVPDPWYTGDFEETYQLVREGCRSWLERLS
ncbi:low molecular weight protein-tyrosine-phosphatase [Streptococcus downei]|nr:low molecular weight protein-tyrosine-phosphatase [Streptococcus downei]